MSACGTNTHCSFLSLSTSAGMPVFATIRSKRFASRSFASCFDAKYLPLGPLTRSLPNLANASKHARLSARSFFPNFSSFFSDTELFGGTHCRSAGSSISPLSHDGIRSTTRHGRCLLAPHDSLATHLFSLKSSCSPLSHDGIRSTTVHGRWLLPPHFGLLLALHLPPDSTRSLSHDGTRSQTLHGRWPFLPHFGLDFETHLPDFSTSPLSHDGTRSQTLHARCLFLPHFAASARCETPMVANATITIPIHFTVWPPDGLVIIATSHGKPDPVKLSRYASAGRLFLDQ